MTDATAVDGPERPASEPGSGSGIDLDDCLDLMRLAKAGLTFNGCADGGVSLTLHGDTPRRRNRLPLEPHEALGMEGQLRQRFPCLFTPPATAALEDSEDWTVESTMSVDLAFDGEPIRHRLLCERSRAGLLFFSAEATPLDAAMSSPAALKAEHCQAWLDSRRQTKLIRASCPPGNSPPSRPRL